MLQAQDKRNLTPANADCSGIIDLLPKDTVFGPTTAPVGSGQLMEIQGEKNSLYSFEKEHNTVWYRFRVPVDCILSFDIIPQSTKDDYDFLLYRFTGKSFCSDVAAGKLKPVRSCISRFDPAVQSVTGLRVGAEDTLMHSGPGPSFVKPLEVKTGEIFVLVLDNVYPGGQGHTLKLHYRKKPQEQAQQNNTVPVAEKTALGVTIVDKLNGVLLDANAKLFLKKKGNTAPLAVFDSVSSFKTDLSPNTTYLLKIEKQGYFDYSKEIKTLTGSENLTMKAEMDRIIVGGNVVFENILFYGNEARILPGSEPALESLEGTMKKNPAMVIEIQGHVNCPQSWESCQTRKMNDFNMNLSKARAKAVYDYLVGQGVEATRMTYVGFGATQMLYPDARSEDKMEKNRRVEIRVVSNAASKSPR